MKTGFLLAGFGLLSLAGVSVAQTPIVYPAKGQSSQTQTKDSNECATWAKQNSGYDPAAPTQTTQPAAAAPPPPRGGVVKGAAAGAAIGAITDSDVSDAAARGAVVGGVAQAGRRFGQQEAAARQNQAAQQQQAANQAALQDTYNRAFSACMSGRGYTVK